MNPSPSKVAAIFQSPPIMLAQIRAWMKQVYCANILAQLEEREQHGSASDVYQKVIDDINAIPAQIEHSLKDLKPGQVLRFPMQFVDPRKNPAPVFKGSLVIRVKDREYFNIKILERSLEPLHKFESWQIPVVEFALGLRPDFRKSRSYSTKSPLLMEVINRELSRWKANAKHAIAYQSVSKDSSPIEKRCWLSVNNIQTKQRFMCRRQERHFQLI